MFTWLAWMMVVRSTTTLLTMCGPPHPPHHGTPMNAEFAGPLHREQIVRLFHDAEHGGIARRISTDPARVLVGDVEADAAVDDALLHGGERIGQFAHFVAGTLEQEERETLCRLGSDAGQTL